MNDKEARKEVKQMLSEILDVCMAYAVKDGLPVSTVLRSVAHGLTLMADKNDVLEGNKSAGMVKRQG